MNRTAGQDADVLLYRSAFAAQTTIHELFIDDKSVSTFTSKRELNELLSMYEGDYEHRVESTVVPKPVDAALGHCDKTIQLATVNTKSNNIICYLSGNTNFREDIATIKPYKGNRILAKPYHYQAVRDHILNKYNTVVSEGCEADDLLATHLYKEYLHSAKTKNKMHCRFVCCSIDKDLNTVPGWHYDYNKRKKPNWVTNKEAFTFFWQQTLIGDVADNIPGIDGIGPSKSFKLLSPLINQREMFLVVAKAYQLQYGDNWLNSLKEVGRLLHMQRSPNEIWTIKQTWVDEYERLSEQLQG